MKTAIINARVRPELKEDVESIFTQLGMTTTQAITFFFEQVRMNGGMPFELKVPEHYQQGKANPALSFWEGIEKFRAEADLDVLDGENLLDGVRDKSTGREVKL
jgi:addiction module RelB/DinJ family antitoxin